MHLYREKKNGHSVFYARMQGFTKMLFSLNRSDWGIGIVHCRINNIIDYHHGGDLIGDSVSGPLFIKGPICFIVSIVQKWKISSRFFKCHCLWMGKRKKNNRKYLILLSHWQWHDDAWCWVVSQPRRLLFSFVQY